MSLKLRLLCKTSLERPIKAFPFMSCTVMWQMSSFWDPNVSWPLHTPEGHKCSQWSIMFTHCVCPLFCAVQVAACCSWKWEWGKTKWQRSYRLYNQKLNVTKTFVESQYTLHNTKGSSRYKNSIPQVYPYVSSAPSQSNLDWPDPYKFNQVCRPRESRESSP